MVISSKFCKSIRKALLLSKGTLIIGLDEENEIALSEQKICPVCGSQFPDLTAQHFSPNTPFGMCQTCSGLGTQLEVDPTLIIENASVSILDGAVRWFGNLRKSRGGTWPIKDLPGLARHYEVEIDLPWQELPQTFRNLILFGVDSIPSQQTSIAQQKNEKRLEDTSFQGLVYHINRIFRQFSSEGVRNKCESYMQRHTCPTCHGTRLFTAVRSITLSEKTIEEVGSMPIDQVLIWLDTLYAELDDEAFTIASEALKEARSRLQFMLDVGLHYLPLNRPAPSLS